MLSNDGTTANSKWHLLIYLQWNPVNTHSKGTCQSVHIKRALRKKRHGHMFYLYKGLNRHFYGNKTLFNFLTIPASVNSLNYRNFTLIYFCHTLLFLKHYNRIKFVSASASEAFHDLGMFANAFIFSVFVLKSVMKCNRG